MKKNLMLRGAIDFVGHAIVHMGKGHRVDEWGDGSYLDPAIENADRLLNKALWELERELEREKNANRN